jgi:uncharacterized protein (DUF1499 family)
LLEINYDTASPEGGKYGPHMKKLLIIPASIISALVAVFIIWFFILGILSRAGKASGITQGALSRCPDTPNCVCSEYKDDFNHYVDPIILPQDSTLETLPILKDIIRDMRGTIHSEGNNYIAATFSSRIFRFVDDFEIRVDPALKIVHIRSASRVGRGDMGINKKRAELFKELFSRKVLKTK